MNLIFNAEKWDDEEYIISVRPKSEFVWKAVSIGSTVSGKAEAIAIMNWLRSAAPDLLQLFKNLQTDEEVEKNPLEDKTASSIGQDVRLSI